MRFGFRARFVALVLGASWVVGCDSAFRDGVSTGIEESVSAAIAAVTDAIIARLLDDPGGMP